MHEMPNLSLSFIVGKFLKIAFKGVKIVLACMNKCSVGHAIIIQECV